MGRAYSDITFTAAVRDIQSRMGSREQYAFLDQATERQDRLGRREVAFIQAADHFYQATVSETGWPYVQHRGGPTGFLKALDEKTLGFADFKGNVQYITVGNLKKDDRISIIVMDYANQMRLKIIGRARTVEAAEDADLMERVRVAGYKARIERAFIITVEGYDWNCPQHITPRFTEKEMATMVAPLHAQLKRQKAQLEQLEHPGKTAAASLPRVLGDGGLALKITGMRELTQSVRAYELRRPNGALLPAFSAGAHIEVPVRLDDGTTSTRSYSIASDPNQRHAIEIAVLRDEAGTGGSLGAHAQFRLGLVLNCSYPENNFILREETHPVVLIAGGIGITPLKAMAHVLQAQHRAFTLHYAVRSRHHAPYLEQLQAAFGAQLVLYAADEGARIDLGQVLSGAGPDSVFYACGPERMLNAVQESADRAAIAHDRIRFERFTASAHRAADAPIQVTLQRSGKTIDVSAARSILDAVEAAGISTPASCRVGNCGTCMVKVLAGTPDHRDYALNQSQRTDQRLMCICVSRAKSRHLTLDL